MKRNKRMKTETHYRETTLWQSFATLAMNIATSCIKDFTAQKGGACQPSTNKNTLKSEFQS
jgi:hypothetical protein